MGSIEQYMEESAADLARGLEEAAARALRGQIEVGGRLAASALLAAREWCPGAVALIFDLDEDGGSCMTLVEGADCEPLWVRVPVAPVAIRTAANLAADAQEAWPSVATELDVPNHDGSFRRFRVGVSG